MPSCGQSSARLLTEIKELSYPDALVHWRLSLVDPHRPPLVFHATSICCFSCGLLDRVFDVFNFGSELTQVPIPVLATILLFPPVLTPHIGFGFLSVLWPKLPHGSWSRTLTEVIGLVCSGVYIRHAHLLLHIFTTLILFDLHP
jgi:hypothetical protein